MIVFDLSCGGGHVFEAWFGSSADWESQRAAGLVRCPVCDSGAVTKAVMAPRLATGAAEPAPAPEATTAVAAPAAPPAELKAMLAALAQAQARLLEKSEWVGRRFAAEARAIHHGESETRAIHGEASLDEVRDLAAEGIDLTPLPLPVLPPDEVQ